MTVSENHEDILFTEGFRIYADVLHFQIYLCRGADPESIVIYQVRKDNTVVYRSKRYQVPYGTYRPVCVCVCRRRMEKSFLPILTILNHGFCRWGGFQLIPIFSMLCSAGFYFWIMMAELYLLLSKKKYRYIIGLVPAIMYWGTCLLGPVVLLRYAYSYMLAALMMLGPALMQKGDY